jgi:hypothetical protein
LHGSSPALFEQSATLNYLEPVKGPDTPLPPSAVGTR